MCHMHFEPINFMFRWIIKWVCCIISKRNSVKCYVKISWLASFSCVKQFYWWLCFIRVLSRQPEEGRNFSTPRPTFLGARNPRRGVKSVKNINFLISCPILTFDGSFFSAQWEEQLLFRTFFSKTPIYPSGRGYCLRKGHFRLGNREVLM